MKTIFIGLNKCGYRYQVNIFLLSPQKTYVVGTHSVPHKGASNEYPEHTFSWRNKKNINTFGLKKCILSGPMKHVGTVKILGSPCLSHNMRNYIFGRAPVDHLDQPVHPYSLISLCCLPEETLASWLSTEHPVIGLCRLKDWAQLFKASLA